MRSCESGPLNSSKSSSNVTIRLFFGVIRGEIFIQWTPDNKMNPETW